MLDIGDLTWYPILSTNNSYLRRRRDLLISTQQGLLPQENFEQLQNRCRELGLKLTHQRLEVFRELASTDDHPSADTIYKRVRARVPTISLDTVYRTLWTLEDHALIARVHAFDDRARFDANLTPHQHLICTRCKSVRDFH
jgi:Fur family peroxide stress response transcriptional regulator